MSEMPSKTALNNALTQVNKKLRWGFIVTHASHATFLLLITWLHFYSGTGNIKIWLVKVAPLLILIPGFIKGYYRTYSWLCFAILPYFVFITPSLFEAFAWKNWLQMSLTVVMFIASMMTSRWMQQQSYLGWQIQNTAD